MIIEHFLLQEQVQHLKSMIEWVVEAHGNSVTTEYTGNDYTLKEYVDQQLLEYEQLSVDMSKEHPTPIVVQVVPETITDVLSKEEYSDLLRLTKKLVKHGVMLGLQYKEVLVFDQILKKPS